MNKFHFLLFSMVCLFQPLIAQNIISNPSFEISNPLPSSAGQLDNATNWTCLVKTCDLLHEITFPNHPWAFQTTPGANTGEGYAGFYGNGTTTFEAIIQELSSPILAGETYEVSAFTKRSMTGFLETCPLNVEIYGLNEMIPYQENAHLSNSPEATLLWSSETFSNDEWINLTGSFTAPNNFDFIAITGAVCLPTTSGYFFLDDMEITGVTNPPPPLSNGCGEASYSGRGGISGSNLFNPQIIANGSSPIVSFYQANSTTDVNTLLQLDEQGNVEWAKTYQYPTSVRSADVAVTSDGGIVNISSLSNNLEVQKVNEAGDLIWARRYNNAANDASINSLVVDDNDGLFITGTIGTVFTGGTDGFILKTEANGDVDWSRKYLFNFLSPTDISFGDAILSSDEGIILTGRANGLPLIAGISNIGTIRWARVFDEEMPLIARSLALNHTNDGFYLIYNGGPLNAQTIKIAEFTLNGNFIRGREFTSPGLGASPSHLVIQSNGNILLHGDFDTGFGTSETPFFILLDEDWNILEARSFDNYANEEADNNFGKSFVEIDGELIAVHALFDGSFDFSILKVQNDLGGDCPSESLNFSFTDFALSPESFTINVTNETVNVQNITPTITDETIEQSFVCNEIASDDFTDVSVAIIETNCINGNVLVEIEICNEGTTEIPAGLPVAFYEVNPTTTAASIFADLTTPFSLLPDSCFSQIIPWTGGENFFAVANTDASQPSPFNLTNDFTGSAFEECDYENNFAQAVVSTPNSSVLDLGDDLFFCETQLLTLNASDNFSSYLWNTGETTAQITTAVAGTYTVEVTDNCGLIQTDEITVNFESANPIDLGEDFTVCAGESVLLDAGNYAAYQWSENLDGTCETCQLFVYLAVIDQTVTVEVTDFDGCISRDTINIEAQGTLVGSETLTICEGDSIEINGTFYSETTNVSFFTNTYNGCDSFAIVNLLVEESILTNETLTFCTGQTATVFGEIYNQDAILTETFSSQNGCDSTHEVTLLFTPPDSTFTVLQPCEGEVITLDGVPVTEDAVLTTMTAAPNGCISYAETIVEFQENSSTAETREACEGTVVEINQTIYTDDEIIEITLTAANGCDSIHTIDLVFIENVSTSENLQACEGDIVTITGIDYFENAVVTQELTGQNGCDSTHQINLEFFEAVFSFETIQSCASQPVEVAGITVFRDTTIVLNLSSSYNCDSTHQIDILFLDETTTFETQQYCQGDIVTIDGTDYFESTVITQELAGQNGCDSTHQIDIEFFEAVFSFETIQSCASQPVEVAGITVFRDTTIVLNLSSSNNCDSTHQIDILFLDETTTFETQQYCQGDMVTVDGTDYFESTVITQELTGQNGCDSTHQISIEFFEAVFSFETIQSCASQPVEVAGITVFRDTTIVLNLSSSNNCDSTHQIDILFLDELTTAETQQYCQGDMITIDGTDYFENASITQELIDQNGCDSTHIITLIFNQTVSTSALIESCEGESITIFGNEITENQVISANFQAFNGCDSTHTVEVIFQETTFTDETQEFCIGDTALIFGNILTENDLVIGTFTGENGCDSLHEVTIIFNEVIEINRTETLCPDDFLLFFGDTIREAGTYQNTTPATSDNCEIIETVEVNFSPAFNYSLPTDTTIQVGSFFQIPLETTGSNLTFSWSNAEALSCTNCQTPTLIVEENTSFSVLILDDNNCFQQATINVLTKAKERISIPNIFSPNDDGINDYFTIFSNTENAVVERMQVFSRWGALVFDSQNVNLNDVNSGWDGTFNGKLLDAGVFIYQIEIRTENGQMKLFSGDVTLVR